MNFNIKYDTGIKTNSSLCIFASYHKYLYVEDYIYYYLNYLVESGFDIVFVSNSEIQEYDQVRLTKLCKRIIEKDNAGLDFSGYKVGLSTEDYGRNYDNLLLTNVSIYGPLFPIQKIIKEMERFDFWGLAESYEQAYHLQSFFLYFNRKVTASEVWQTFWNEVRELENKEEIVSSYEIGLSRRLIKSSLFNYSSLIKHVELAKYIKKLNGNYFAEGVANHNRFNYTLYYWDLLIEKYNFPFLKKTLIDRSAHWKESGIISRHWKSVIEQNTSYPVNLIKEE